MSVLLTLILTSCHPRNVQVFGLLYLAPSDRTSLQLSRIPLDVNMENICIFQEPFRLLQSPILLPSSYSKTWKTVRGAVILSESCYHSCVCHLLFIREHKQAVLEIPVFMSRQSSNLKYAAFWILVAVINNVFLLSSSGLIQHHLCLKEAAFWVLGCCNRTDIKSTAWPLMLCAWQLQLSA